MSGIVITDEMKRAAVIAHLEWEHHKDHWEKVVEAALALVPHPPEGGMEAGEPVAWTGSGSLAAITRGLAGHLYQTKADAHPIPLYTSPIPARSAEGMVTDAMVDAYKSAIYGQQGNPLMRENIRIGLKAALALASPIPARDSARAEWVEDIERVILRRLRQERIEGYTLEMAREIAALSLSPGTGEKDERIAEPTGWRTMDSAPLDGKHCILAVKSGAFIYSVQGAFHDGQWDCAMGDNVDPLYWMPNVRLPEGWEASLTAKEGLR